MMRPARLSVPRRLVGMGLALAGLAGIAVAQDDPDESGLSGLPATRDRPLFSPTRRAPPKPKPGGPAAGLALPPALTVTVPRPTLELSGVIVGEGEEVAIVQRRGDAKTVTVKVGTTIDGWTVSAIAPRAITLRHDADSMVVALPERGR